MTEQVVTADGRHLGNRALATRRRILDATARLLDDIGVFDLRVVDIARSIDSSPATFYQYFSDVDSALLALADEATLDERPLVDFLHPAWDPTDGLERAHDFVDAYTAFWDSHHAILRVRNIKAEEGDPRFRATRSKAHLLIIEGLQAMVGEGIASGRLSSALDPFTTAAALVAMIERLLAFRPEMARRGADRTAIRETLATLLFETLTGVAATTR